MAKTVKMCDMSGHIATWVFQSLNVADVKVCSFGHNLIIVTDKEPTLLVYPEGWYYGKGAFRNKHNSTTGVYEEIPMVTSNGENWGDIAKYCTR